jgi:hypothetical protein
MEHVHSILIIKKGNKYLNYYDDRWNMLLFPNIKGNDIEDIKKYIKDKFGIETSNIKQLFDKVHDKYSIPNKEVRTYHHYFYEIDEDIDGNYYELKDLLLDDKVRENNSDIIEYVKEYYN